jgi:geranylgeranyl diphosphate synthase type I
MTETVAGSEQIWDRTRRLVEQPMLDALSRLDAETRLVSGYHLGYWDADGKPGGGAGKGVRPSLALLSARAAGAPAEVGVPAAVACELVHNFSLLHDDVMDRDTERRHRPTAWTCFGVSPAILAGDALLSLANEVLAEAPSPTVPWALRCLNTTTRALIAGQMADLAFESRDRVSLEECVDMAGNKTGALLSCAASLGAVLADGEASLALGLAEYGKRIGLAFQVVDDLLGIWGSPERTGKPVWSDLRSRKKSLPVVAAMTSGGPAAEEFAEFYTAERTWTEDDLAHAADLVERAGGRRWAEETIARESQAALDALDDLALPADVRAELDTLTQKLSGRDC